MFENKSKKPTLRSVTSKSTSRGKMNKKQMIQVIYTDTTNLKTQKSKSQCLSGERIGNRKSINISKITKKSSWQKPGMKKSTGFNIEEFKISPRKTEIGVRSREKPAQLKWTKKRSTSKKLEGKSCERQKLSWNQKRIPYDWETVLSEYTHLLTRHQASEIKEYKKIYYIGHKAKKKERIDLSQTNFDNEEREYNFVLNDHIGYRYEILGVAGKGSYGQVFRVFDHKKKQQLALKMVKNRTKFNKQAFIQIRILTYIKQQDTEQMSNIVKIKDFIIFRKHVCLFFELLSENLYELIIRNNYNGLSVELIRRFAIQILVSLDFLRKHNIIHCDLKPQNILLREYTKSGIKIIDLGSSCFSNETIYTYIQSRYYRAPEITLGIQYSTMIDMWSAGCIFAELYTGVPLFPGENQEEQMKYLVDTLGVPPDEMLKEGNRVNVFFSQKKQLKKEIRELKTIQYFSRKLEDRIPDASFREFVMGFLKWNPSERITPLEALKSDWVQKGTPEHLRNFEAFTKNEPEISKSSPMFKVKAKSKEKKKLSSGAMQQKFPN